VVWTTQTTDAVYYVYDKNGLNPSIHINQSKDNIGASQPNGTQSGFKDIGNYQFDSGMEYYIMLDGDSNDDNHVFADAVKVNHQNVKPSTPTLLYPADGGYVNGADPTPLLDWSDSTDDGDAVRYELYVDDDSSFLTPAISKVVPSGLVISEYQTTLPELPDNTMYFWYVRAWDGYGYSVMSSINTFTVDRVKPVITLVGDANVTVEAGDSYTDDGATANDNRDGDITANIVTTSNVDTSTVGSYQVMYDVTDAAGNPADQVIRTVDVVDSTAPVAPEITLVQSGKNINVSWNSVSGASYYYVYIGTTSGNGYIAKSDKIYGTSYSHSVSDYGTYYVRVTAVDTFGNESGESDSVSKQKSITLSATSPVIKAVAGPVEAPISVAPESAVVVGETPTVDEGTGLDEQGKILGDENTDTSEEEDINWTPWIILFILIVLAGAATGGYFYWFSGEEEMEEVTEVKEKKSAPKSAPKKQTPSPKKSRRW
jgi:hypothetical protein